MYAPPTLPPLPPPPRRIELDLWLMLGIMIAMLLLLCSATAVMMAIGGVFLPFGFDSDFFARLLPLPVLVSLASSSWSRWAAPSSSPPCACGASYKCSGMSKGLM